MKPSNNDEMRVQKFLSRAGLCSRRSAESWMQQGRVKINGEVCRELGTKIDPARDRVEVDGKPVSSPESHIYILLNKPQGYITSMHDPEGRPIITDLLPQNMPRIWPVGRLDWNSEGIILLTNDGKLTHLLTHPSHLVPKHYAVKVQGRLEQESPDLTTLIHGVDLEMKSSRTRRLCRSRRWIETPGLRSSFRKAATDRFDACSRRSTIL